VSQKRCKIGPRLLLITNRKRNTSFQLPPRWMTLDDLEHENEGFMHFWKFWAVRHISRMNCAEITSDRPKQHAHEIFSIKRGFRQSRFLSFTFKKACTRGHHTGVPLQNARFRPVRVKCWCGILVTPSSKTIDTSHHYHRCVECRLLRSLSLDKFAVGLHSYVHRCRMFPLRQLSFLIYSTIFFGQLWCSRRCSRNFSAAYFATKPRFT